MACIWYWLAFRLAPPLGSGRLNIAASRPLPLAHLVRVGVRGRGRVGSRVRVRLRLRAKT